MLFPDVKLTCCRGNALGIGSICALVAALELGGSGTPWLSAEAGIPLHMGAFCLILFVVYEWRYYERTMVNFNVSDVTRGAKLNRVRGRNCKAGVGVNRAGTEKAFLTSAGEGI